MKNPQPISVSAMILCDGVATDAIAGKITIIGCSGGFRVRELPTILPPFAVYIAFSEVTRAVELVLQIMTIDEEIIYEAPAAKAHPGDALTMFEYDARFIDVEIEQAGDYFVRLLADGVYITDKRFVVLYGDSEER